jgi:hypothetical protein
VDMDEEKHDDMEEVEKYHPLVLIMEIWAMFLYFSPNRVLSMGTIIV